MDEDKSREYGKLVAKVKLKYRENPICNIEELVGRFSCKGFDTFGPFKLIGGVAKGHPDDRDLAAAVEFYKKLIAGGVVNE